jgi:hypothetical protein
MQPRHPLPTDFGLKKISYRRREVMEEILLVGETTLHKLVKIGQLKCIKVGKTTIFLAVDLADFLDKSRRGGSRPDRRRSHSSTPHQASDKSEPHEAPDKLEPTEQGGAS